MTVKMRGGYRTSKNCDKCIFRKSINKCPCKKHCDNHKFEPEFELVKNKIARRKMKEKQNIIIYELRPKIIRG